MQPISAQQAYNEIVAHIKEQKGAYRNWYAGITNDWGTRLFNDHNVPKKNSWYIARECSSNEGARNVEKALLELGCDGGEGGGDDSSVYVYAYLKTTVTDP